MARSPRGGRARGRRHLGGLAGVAALVAGFALVVSFVAKPRGGAAEGAWGEAGGPRIRVALVLEVGSVRVEVRGPFAVHAVDGDLRAPQRGAPLFTSQEGLAEAEARARSDGALVLGERALGRAAAIVAPAQDGALFVDGQGYRGDLLLVGAKGRVSAINRVALEPYTAGVLGAEMPLGFPEPALQAQAVAARTYALFHHQRRFGKAIYDVKDDTSSQVYKGLAVETDKARRVVEGTRGLVLAWEGKPLQAYFHSTCGGDTIPARFVFGERDIPPFGGAPCGFCTDSRYYEWTATTDRAALVERLARHAVRGPVRAVRVKRTGPAEHVAEVEVEHAGGVTTISGSAFRMAVGPSVVRATRFRLEDGPDGQVVIRGRGWGHAVGLCQIGARGMARAGHDGEAILRHYYPRADLLRVSER